VAEHGLFQSQMKIARLRCQHSVRTGVDVSLTWYIWYITPEKVGIGLDFPSNSRCSWPSLD
jgi:hypothetical protein